MKAIFITDKSDANRGGSSRRHDAPIGQEHDQEVEQGLEATNPVGDVEIIDVERQVDANKWM